MRWIFIIRIIIPKIGWNGDGWGIWEVSDKWNAEAFFFLPWESDWERLGNYRHL